MDFRSVIPVDFRAEIQNIIRYLEGEDYDAAAKRCLPVIEQALKQALKQSLPKLTKEDHDKVREAIRKRRNKSIDRFTLGDFVYFFRESEFLDAWERVSGKTLSRTWWSDLDILREFRNKETHEILGVTKAQAEVLLDYLRATLENFELIDMNDADSMFSSNQKPNTSVLSNTSEKTHSTAWFTHGHGLIIGVGADLPNTISDAKGIAGILQDPSRCAYPQHQVTLLTGEQASRKAILSAFETLAQTTDTESTVIIYFSGHGYQPPHTTEKKYYLLPYGYNIHSPDKTAISGDEFTNKLKAIPSKKLFVLLDCCHAGGIGDTKAPGLNITKKPLPQEALHLLFEGRGWLLLASSRENELSFIYPEEPYSVFTAAVIEAFCGRGMAKQDGYVRVTDLALYAGKVVPERTKEKQHPTLHFEGADNFVLAYYAGGDTQLKDLPFAGIPEIEVNPPDKSDDNEKCNASSSQMIKADRKSKIRNVTMIIKK